MKFTVITPLNENYTQLHFFMLQTAFDDTCTKAHAVTST